jgi:hypothetical protein
MAIEAVPCNVKDAMIGMVLFCFRLIVTAVTIDRDIRPLVTARAIAACAAVAHGEGMALDID